MHAKDAKITSVALFDEQLYTLESSEVQNEVTLHREVSAVADGPRDVLCQLKS